MSSTKKVASSSVVKKTTAKKTARKKAAKKTVVKKSARKVTKKTKKKATKKTSELSVPTKKERKSFNEKLVHLEAIHQNSSVVAEKTLATKTKVELAALSPYRFPMVIDNVVVGTARFAGIFFVVVGAMFTFFNLQAVSGNTTFLAWMESAGQTASICDATDPQFNPDNQDCNVTDSTMTENFVISDPEIRVGASEPLNESVPILIAVQGAESVFVNVYGVVTGDQFKLGAADRVSETKWKMSWPTTDGSDDEYVIEVAVEYQDGSYEMFKSDKTYVVENFPAVISDDKSATTTDNSADIQPGEITVDETEQSIKILDFSVDQNDPVGDQVHFSIKTKNAEKVKLLAVNTETKNKTKLGYAFILNDLDEAWRLSYDTKQLPDGNYKIIAQALNGLKEFKVQDLNIQIANLVTTDESDSVSSSSEDAAADVAKDIATDVVDEKDVGSEALSAEEMEPEMSIYIKQSTPVSKTIDVRVDVKGVSFVEVFATPVFSAKPKFIGLAKRVDSGRWLLRFDTAGKIPNGEYKIFARVKNKYGTFDSKPVSVVVYNAPVNKYTADQAESLKDLEELNTEEKLGDPVKTYLNIDAKIPEAAENVVTDTAEGVNEQPEFTPEDSQSELAVEEVDEVTDEHAIDLMFANFRNELEDEFGRLAAALRSKDQRGIEKTKNRIEKIKEKIVKSALTENQSERLVKRIDKRLAEAVVRVEADVVKTEKIVKERTGESITKDSDDDGITDYDEVTIFSTDPFSADSDNDGFNDGAEILGGFNPTDDTPEALVEFESPKEVGITREDILVVEDVVSAEPQIGDEDGVTEEAVIFGKALPNSFVTLYIFSTPVVVTVKTDADGSWQYRFDKELEDGEHEVYVGVTDNAGKIIAKSEPFRFVKEAEAFTPVDAAEEVAIAQTDSTPFINQLAIMVVLSISVVAVGVVLIMIGLHMDGENRRRTLVAKEAVSTT